MVRGGSGLHERDLAGGERPERGPATVRSRSHHQGRQGDRRQDDADPGPAVSTQRPGPLIPGPGRWLPAARAIYATGKLTAPCPASGCAASARPRAPGTHPRRPQPPRAPRKGRERSSGRPYPGTTRTVSRTGQLCRALLHLLRPDMAACAAVGVVDAVVPHVAAQGLDGPVGVRGHYRPALGSFQPTHSSCRLFRPPMSVLAPLAPLLPVYWVSPLCALPPCI